MHTNLEKPGQTTARTQAPKRSIFLSPVFILVLLVAGSIIGYQVFKNSRTSASSADASGASSDSLAGANQEPDELKPVEVQPQEKPPEWNGVVKRGNVAARNPGSAAPAPAPGGALSPEAAAASAQAQQIIGELGQVDLSKGVLTPEQAQAMSQNLKKLAQQGAGAVPAIKAFLDRNQDLSFDDVKGGKDVGYASLRAGLFDALKQIGGPEAVGLMVSTLQTTADPREIALLARNLEEGYPGQYSQETLNAVRETLDQAAKGELGKRDVGPLFQLLQTMGDSTISADLQKNLGQWNYYATMAMAGLPDGAGVPGLVSLIKDSTVTGSGKGNFALQMLAQIAPQYPDAGAALVEQARLNQIPERAWRQVVTGLSGDQYQFVKDLADGSVPARTLSDLKFYHIEYGNQNFYSTPATMNWQEEEINQRRALIDKLLAVTTNPAAAQMLQAGRDSLSIPKPQK